MAQRDLTHLSAFLDQLRPLIPEPAAAQFNLLNILIIFHNINHHIFPPHLLLFADQNHPSSFTCVRLEVSSYRNHLTVLLSDSSNYLILSNIIKTVRKMKSYSK